VTDAARQDESNAARGARWIAVGMVTVGLSNYGYALLLTHLLSVNAYSTYAAGQGLILWATNVSAVSVPWVLAQALVRAQSDTERLSAIRFAKLASAGSGIIAAVVVGAIATRFAASTTALVVGLSTFVIFLGTTATGWLQGRERMRSLALLYIAENALKNGAGLLLVMVARLGGAGALGAFGIGGAAMLVRWPRTPHVRGRPSKARANRDLWRRAVAIAGAQGVVSLFVAIDVVLVALLPGNRALAASYQASATLTRIPLYVAGAIATAFFPSLSRRATGKMIAARAVRMYAAVALPLAAILATIPAPILTAMFPDRYGAVAALLKFTAVTGLAAGGISLITAFFQAADDYSCLRWLGAGVAGYVGALLVGWRVDGIIGLAAGGALGASAALVLMGCRLVRGHGRGVLAGVRLAEPFVVAAALVVLRSHAMPWMALAFLAGLRAAVRFVRPGARHARTPRWVTPGKAGTNESSALSLLIDTVWRGTTPKATETELRDVLTLGRMNRVEGRLARAYPAQLASVLAEVRSAGQLYRDNLHRAASRLQRAEIPAVLIESAHSGDHTCTNIDLVVFERDWHHALTALADCHVYRSTYQLEQSTTALLYPSTGPGLHLHTDLSWFGVPMLSTGLLLARARRNRLGILIPAPADYLRIWLGNALFQDLTFDLSQLLSVHDLLRPAVIAAARAEASLEGWVHGFDDALAAAEDAIHRLNQGLPLSLPVPLPVSNSRAGDPAVRSQGLAAGRAALAAVRHLARGGRDGRARRDRAGRVDHPDTRSGPSSPS
jgi:O-antigen/teichoic acid export membrane protein